jgi:polysaccharide biosynthesis protein PslH
MNILFICHRIPYPPNKGDKIRSFHEIKYLSKVHSLYLAFMIDDERDLSYVQELRKYCTDLDYDVIRPQWKKIKSIPYLLTDKPLTVPYFYSKKLQGAIDKRLDETPIDAIICFSSPMAEYAFKSKSINVRDVRNVQDVQTIEAIEQFEHSNRVEHVEQAKRLNNSNDSNMRGCPRLIMDFVDVDSDKWRMYADAQTFPISSIYRREWKRLMNYEKKVGEIADWSLFVSEKEVELFKSFCPHARTTVIQNGVDLEYYGDVRTFVTSEAIERFEHLQRLEHVEQAKRSNILFIGAMDYFPNEDAVLYFFDAIWPYVKEKLPAAKFFVVGGNPSRRVQSLPEKDPYVVVTGYAPDVRSYFRMADVFVAPLRVARGIQNKVLEAMASGVPVVARSEAVQGLSSLNGCVMVENDNKRFAFSILKVLQMPLKRSKMIADSKRFILKNHNWEENLSKLEELLHKEE